MSDLRERLQAIGFSPTQDLRSEVPNGDREKERLEAMASRWEPEPDIPRVAHGIKDRVNRLRALGNSVVPQVVEIIGRAIMECEG